MHVKRLSLLFAFSALPGALLAQAPVEDIGGPLAQQRSGQRDMQGELYHQLQQLRQEIMELRGTVEEQGHQIRQLKQQGLDRYIDLDRRISAAAGGALPGGESEDAMLDGAAQSSGMGELAAPSQNDESGNSPTAGASAAAAVGAAPSSGYGESTTSNPDTGNNEDVAGGDPSSDYAKAYGLVRDRQFPEAIAAFDEYVKTYPDGRYTPNAWYWLGELHIAVKPQNLAAAGRAFQKLLADYPNSGKVPAAMYKLATVYYLDGQKQKAKEMLTHVIDRYSNTGNSAVQKSREFLRKNF